MYIKKIFVLILFCFCINVGYAQRLVTFDSVAMETALGKIKKIGSGSPYKTLEDAQDAFSSAFENLANYDDTIDIDKVMDKCEEIIKNTRTCAAFINEYNKYLDHGNYCKRSDKFKAGNFSFNECREYVMDNDISYSKRDTSGKIYKQCVSWIESAQKCRFYLIEYYVEKLSNSDESDKKYYECILDKLQEGDMDFPISRMEKSCK
ncbi:MAG: hypothetical protein IKN73_00620 [Alphaproteobacteria bacterium]|nr:hypothetical protein [Alphaproteobacteria bacterium]